MLVCFSDYLPFYPSFLYGLTNDQPHLSDSNQTFDLVSSLIHALELLGGAFNSSLKRRRQNALDKVSTLILYSVKASTRMNVK